MFDRVAIALMFSSDSFDMTLVYYVNDAFKLIPGFVKVERG